MAPGILGFLGLARREQVRESDDRAAAQKQRAGEIQVRLEASKLETERWKWKHEQLTADLKAATGDRDRWKTKAAERNEVLTRLERLDRAQRTIAQARSHLLAMETKLDVIEGALNVLDRRTREPDAAAGGAGRPPDRE